MDMVVVSPKLTTFSLSYLLTEIITTDQLPTNRSTHVIVSSRLCVRQSNVKVIVQVLSETRNHNRNTSWRRLMKIYTNMTLPCCWVNGHAAWVLKTFWYYWLEFWRKQLKQQYLTKSSYFRFQTSKYPQHLGPWNNRAKRTQWKQAKSPGPEYPLVCIHQQITKYALHKQIRTEYACVKGELLHEITENHKNRHSTKSSEETIIRVI